MIIENANELRFADFNNTYSKIPLGTYSLKYDAIRNEFYLIKVSEMKITGKIYGNNDAFINRVLKTYRITLDSIGVLLKGIKGAGKTITAKMLANASQLPIIIINEDYSSEANIFKDFLNGIRDEVVVYIDEFDKIYGNYNDQQVFLDILDGAISSKKLFILTSNSEYINEFMTNRLKRIRYCKSYENLEDDIINEVIQDSLVNKTEENIRGIKDVINSIGIKTLDILISLIEEMNIHNFSAFEAIKDLNVINEKVQYNFYTYNAEKQTWEWEDFIRVSNGALLKADEFYLATYKILRREVSRIDYEGQDLIIELSNNDKYKLVPVLVSNSLVF